MNQQNPVVEELIAIYGEQHRKLIEESIPWIIEKQKVWGVTINLCGFVDDLLNRIARD